MASDCVPADQDATGWRVVRLLRARLLGLPAPEPRAGDETLLPDISGGYPIAPPIGLSMVGVPAPWLDCLGWIGVPLSTTGPLHWGEHLRPDAVAAPLAIGGSVALPPPELLWRADGVALRPVRQLVAQWCGCRLQAGPGVHCFLWEAMAMLVSTRSVPLGGFISGPRPGSRGTVALHPGEYQVQRW